MNIIKIGFLIILTIVLTACSEKKPTSDKTQVAPNSIKPTQMALALGAPRDGKGIVWKVEISNLYSTSKQNPWRTVATEGQNRKNCGQTTEQIESLVKRAFLVARSQGQTVGRKDYPYGILFQNKQETSWIKFKTADEFEQSKEFSKLIVLGKQISNRCLE